MSTGSDTSPSLMNNLRCFRFQKKPTIGHSHSGASDHGNLDTCTAFCFNVNAYISQCLQHANDEYDFLYVYILASDVSPVQVNRRRIKPISESDSDCDRELIMAAATATPSSSVDVSHSNENSNSSVSNDYIDKGQQMRIMMETFPDHDIMVFIYVFYKFLTNIYLLN